MKRQHIFFVFHHSPLKRGFSLVELLVTLGVVAVLIGILIPALGGAKRAANDLEITAHQRTVGQTLVLAYTNDHSGALPYYGIPGTDEVIDFDLPFGTWAGSPYGGYWYQRNFWNAYLHTLGYDGTIAVLYPDQENPLEVLVGAAMDQYTMAAMAEPRLFARGAPAQDDVTLHAGKDLGDVRHPSKKGLLIRGQTLGQETGPDTRSHVFFADGHAVLIRDDTLLPGVSAGDLFGGAPVLTTEDGVLGRDIP